MSDGDVRMGLPRNAATPRAAKCVRGAATMALETGRPPPGTLRRTKARRGPAGRHHDSAAVHALECGRLRAALINAVVAATEKSRELGRARAARAT